jgi:RNA-directed DNA polymerase
MSEQPVEIGVGQLSLTFGIPAEGTKDEAQETQDNGPAASTTAPAVRSEPTPKRKWHSLIDKVYAKRNVALAWQHVAANQGAAGVDGVTVEQFAERAEERLAQLAEDLRKKTYRPQPVRRVYIPKSGGGQRPLGIPSVRDRIVQQALLQVLQPVFEPTFSTRSHGFRPERGCHTALSVVERAIRHGYSWVVDADIQTFFDTVDHEKLIDAVSEEVADGSVLRLIRQILRAGVSLPSAATTEPTELGTPQGGPLSPLLANIYLSRLDRAMMQAGYGLVRYADDFVIFTKSEGEAAAALSLAEGVLEGELGLRLHPEKTRVVSVAEGFEFLGFHYFCDPRSGVHCKEVRRKSVRRFRDAIRERTPRLRTQRPVKARHATLKRLAANRRVAEIIGSVNRFLKGWHWYFKSIQPRYHRDRPFDKFDYFVRARVRLAITGRVGSGWWQSRINNSVLYQLGLLSLAQLNAEYRAGLLQAPIRKG